MTFMEEEEDDERRHVLRPPRLDPRVIYARREASSPWSLSPLRSAGVRAAAAPYKAGLQPMPSPSPSRRAALLERCRLATDTSSHIHRPEEP